MYNTGGDDAALHIAVSAASRPFAEGTTHNNGPDKGHGKDITNLKLEWRVDNVFLVRLGRGQDIEERAEHREVMASDVGHFEDWA